MRWAASREPPFSKKLVMPAALKGWLQWKRLTNYTGDDVGIVADAFRLAQAAGVSSGPQFCSKAPPSVSRGPVSVRPSFGPEALRDGKHSLGTIVVTGPKTALTAFAGFQFLGSCIPLTSNMLSLTWSFSGPGTNGRPSAPDE